MKKDLKNQPREIIKEFAEEIQKYRIAIPNDKSIPFRDDKIKNHVRKAFKVPIEFLRFRKDNGRIASDVLTYENSNGALNETTDYGQSTLKRFLEMKDPITTGELMNSLTKDGQDEKTVITADGFLINGNRRKMAFEKLLEKNPGNERFKYLEVIILPGLNDKEPVPTLLEIEQLENRYQHQRTGKAEYYNFDMALSIKRKIELGMTLEEQLKDDPNFANISQQELKNKIREFEDNYLRPLECIEKYLLYLKRPGHYNTVSEGRTDSEGRWQAFLDYYNLVYKKIIDEKHRMKLGIDEDEIGKIENVAFKVIRKREFGSSVKKKLHQIMRDIPKLVGNPTARKELFKLVDIDFDLPKEDTTDEKGRQVDEKTKDIIWSNKYSNELIWPVKKAYDILEQKKESDTPIDLLNVALEKLNHSNMDVSIIDRQRSKEAITLTKLIQARANELEQMIAEASKPKQKKTGKTIAKKSKRKK